MTAVRSARPNPGRVDVTGGFDRFFASEYPVLVSLGLALTNDRELARDVAQETLVRALQRWSEVDRMVRPGAWCRQVALNLIRDRWRRGRTERAAIDRVRSITPMSAPAPSTPVDEFWSVVRSLPERQREAVALFYVADRSVADIASALGVAEGTVKGTLHDARRALSERLGTPDLWEGS